MLHYTTAKQRIILHVAKQNKKKALSCESFLTARRGALLALTGYGTPVHIHAVCTVQYCTAYYTVLATVRGNGRIIGDFDFAKKGRRGTNNPARSSSSYGTFNSCCHNFLETHYACGGSF
jgi:hypothetical protein